MLANNDISWLFGKYQQGSEAVRNLDSKTSFSRPLSESRKKLDKG